MNGATKTPLHRWLFRPRRFRLLIGLYPPLLGAGVRVSRIADDWTSGSVAVTVYPWTANLHGAAFGGALFSATDILYGMMLAAQLGREFEVWTKSATIDFRAPGRGSLALDVVVTSAEAQAIRDRAERHGVCDIDHHVTIRDSHGTVVAEATHTLRVRLRRTEPCVGPPTTAGRP